MIYILTGIGVAAIIVALWYFNRTKVDVLNPYLRAKRLLDKNVFQRTPKQARVFVEQKASISTSDLTAMDEGLDSTFERVRCHYTVGDHPALRHAEYEICVFESELTPGGNYAFRVPAGQYAGTEWDQGGYIFAGAMVTGVPGETYTMAIPDQKGRFNEVRNGVSYEAEHWTLAAFDGPKYEATATHGQGQGHPIIPPCGSGLATPVHKHGLSWQEGERMFCVLPVK